MVRPPPLATYEPRGGQFTRIDFIIALMYYQKSKSLEFKFDVYLPTTGLGYQYEDLGTVNGLGFPITGLGQR